MFVHRIKMRDLASGSTFRLDDAEVTLQACAKTGRLLVLIDAPKACRIDMNPDELGPAGAGVD